MKKIVFVILILIVAAVALVVWRAAPQTSRSGMSASTSPAYQFLSQMQSDTKMQGTIVQATSSVLFWRGGNNPISRIINGYRIDTTAKGSYNYYQAHSFKIDSANQGDATFNSTNGYTTDNVICIEKYHTIAPNNDYSICGDAKDDSCTQTSTTFCADIPTDLPPFVEDHG